MGGKIYLKSAIRLFIVPPSDFDLLGINFEGQFYIDKCLPMGCCLSCSLFEKCSSFLSNGRYPGDGVKYCRSLFRRFYFCRGQFVFRLWTIDDHIYWIVPLAENKTVGPTNVVKCLGFVINTGLMMIRKKLTSLNYYYSPCFIKRKWRLNNWNL